MTYRNTLAVALAAIMASSSVGLAAEIEPPKPTTAVKAVSSLRPLEPAVVRASVERYSREVPRTIDTAVKQAPAGGRTKFERAALMAIGTGIGFMAGAYIGYGIDSAVAPCRNEGADCDMVGFRGVVIGAPIGALAGLIASWRMTR